MPHSSDAGLVRAIGTRQPTASIINATIGLLTSATRREFGVEGLVLAVATVFYCIRRTDGQI